MKILSNINAYTLCNMGCYFVMPKEEARQGMHERMRHALGG